MPPTERRAVDAVPADVQVTVDSYDRYVKQRHDAADDAEAGCRCTKPLSSIQKSFLSRQCAFSDTQ